MWKRTTLKNSGINNEKIGFAINGIESMKGQYEGKHTDLSSVFFGSHCFTLRKKCGIVKLTVSIFGRIVTI